jgi:thiosulfate dehydrogenase [quinone] large subunit
MSAKAEPTPQNRRTHITVQDPPIARALLSETRWAWLWLILRLYAGYEWLVAGWQKLLSPAWIGAEKGSAMRGFIQGALSKTGGSHPDVTGWYATFLQDVVLPHTHFWSYVIAIGETLVGIALILGIFTGIAAFFGSFMNMNYLLAGSVSSNPILFIIAVLLILAWKTAGWWGLDRWVLPALGTPWSRGTLFQKEEPAPEAR